MCVCVFTLSFCIHITFYETKLTKDFLLLKTLPKYSLHFILYIFCSASKKTFTTCKYHYGHYQCYHI